MLIQAASLLALAAAVLSAPSASKADSSLVRPNYMQAILAMPPTDEMLQKNDRSIKYTKFLTLDECPKIQRDECQEKLATALNSDVSVFDNSKQFWQLINSYYKMSLEDGLIKLCRAQIEYRRCLGRFYNLCTDPYQLARPPYYKSIADAYALAGVYGDVEFDCGGGFNPSVDNWDCIQKINNDNSYATLTQQCWDSYVKTVQQPDQYCTSGQALALCLTKAYQNINDGLSTGEQCIDDDIKWWVCERAIRRSQIDGWCEHGEHATSCQRVMNPNNNAVDETFSQFLARGGMEHPLKTEFYRLIRARARRGQLGRDPQE